MKKLPLFLRRYFWDVDLKHLNTKDHSKDIIGRILEYGDEKALRWLKKHFTQRELRDCLMRFRFVSPKSANFWRLVFNIPREKVLVLQKGYLRMRQWPY